MDTNKKKILKQNLVAMTHKALYYAIKVFIFQPPVNLRAVHLNTNATMARAYRKNLFAMVKPIVSIERMKYWRFVRKSNVRVTVLYAHMVHVLIRIRFVMA